MSIAMGGNQVAICGCINLDCTKVGFGVSHPCQRVHFNRQCYVRSKQNWKMWPIDCVHILITKQCKEKLYHNWKGSFGDGVRSSQIPPPLTQQQVCFLCRPLALLYLVKKPQISGRITWWLLLFLKYKFFVVYKLEKSHLVVDVLSHLLASNESNGVPNQIVDVPIFLLQPVWLQEIHHYLQTWDFLVSYTPKQKWKLTLKALPCVLQQGKLYKQCQDHITPRIFFNNPSRNTQMGRWRSFFGRYHNLIVLGY